MGDDLEIKTALKPGLKRAQDPVHRAGIKSVNLWPRIPVGFIYGRGYISMDADDTASPIYALSKRQHFKLFTARPANTLRPGDVSRPDRNGPTASIIYTL